MKHASTRAGDKALRAREAQGNPCVGIRPPKDGEGKRRHWLRPTETAALLACESPDVPLAWREAIAIGLYLHLRPGELQELRAKDVDLSVGEVSISRAWDVAGKRVKAPKTSEGVRTVTIPPTLAPLLERLTKGKGPEVLLCPVMSKLAEQDRAEMFRAMLKVAGVDRPELFKDTPTHERCDFRSLRDSGITHRFLAGHRAEVVQREAGHENLATTLGYAKEVQDRLGRYGEPFPVLPFACEPDVTVHTDTPVLPSEMAPTVGLETTSSPQPRGSMSIDVESADVDPRTSPRVHVDATTVDRSVDRSDDPLDRVTRTAAAASAAGEWDIVRIALEELRALRLAQAGASVVDLDAERKRGRR